jgi:hypothetical protein
MIFGIYLHFWVCCDMFFFHVNILQATIIWRENDFIFILFFWLWFTIIWKNIVKIFCNFGMVYVLKWPFRKTIQCDYTKGVTIVCFHPLHPWNWKFPPRYLKMIREAQRIKHVLQLQMKKKKKKKNLKIKPLVSNLSLEDTFL